MNRNTYAVHLNGEKIGSYTGTREPAFATCVTTINGKNAVVFWHETRERAEAARLRALRAGVDWFILPVTKELIPA